jgi:lipid-binding SYLF domain-containing protein
MKPAERLRERAVLAPLTVDPNNQLVEGRDMLKHARVIRTALILVLAITALTYSAAVRPASADELDDDAAAALRSLYEGSPTARVLGEKAAGILVFPNIVKAGFLFGAQFGEGTLFRGGRKVANYRSVAASYGFQAGVQAFGYAMFLMTDSALQYLDKSGGWEVGVGPSIVVVDTGVARNLTTSTIQSDIYAFVFDQRGLMGGVGIQGSKITRVNH